MEMMKVCILAHILLFNICDAEHISTNGTFFKVTIKDEDDLFDDQETRLQIQTVLHQCSMNDSCQTIKKDIKTNELRLSGENRHESWNKGWRNIFKKVKDPENQKQEVIYNSCEDAYDKGNRQNGAYKIWLPGKLENLTVWCDMLTDDLRWIVFQRHTDNSSHFHRTWNEYETGFGDLARNFWLGLENIHKLAAPGLGAILRVDLKYNTTEYETTFYGAFPNRHAQYCVFAIYGPQDGYRIKAEDCNSNILSALSPCNEHCRFSTKDNDQDDSQQNCAEATEGGWWFKSCDHPPNLNGKYGKHMAWSTDRFYGKLAFSEMKIRYSIDSN